MGRGAVATHNGVHIDNDVDPSPGLSGITVAEQGRGESSRLDMLASVAQTGWRK